MKVYTICDMCRLNILNSNTELKLIWERKEEPVEMTISDIEKKLGIKNLKVIKEGD